MEAKIILRINPEPVLSKRVHFCVLKICKYNIQLIYNYMFVTKKETVLNSFFPERAKQAKMQQK